MRFVQYGVLLLLVVGLVALLAFGFGTDDSGVDDNTILLSNSDDFGSSPEPELIVSAAVDFGSNQEYVLDTGILRVNDGKLGVFSPTGDHLADFKVDPSGKMVPTKGQPNGNTIKSAYSGPPGDTYSNYRVYGDANGSGKAASSAEMSGSGKTGQPLVAVDHNGGTVTVTPGSEITRTHAQSVTSRGGYGGSVAGSSAGSCGTSGGGGGGGG